MLFHFEAISAQATIFAYLVSYARAYRAICDAMVVERGWMSRLPFRGTRQGIWSKLSKHQCITFTDLCLLRFNFATAFIIVEHGTSSTNKQVLFLLVESITVVYVW